ncbi:MAG: sigma 54-interacting transcriptional regulator [Acidobacteria bacterium]|nr:sigma 54-interacting transcriptional regulator [Acidobacteriota bacterium]
MAPTDSTAVLAAVARLVADAPKLNELVPHLAAALRQAVPFERLHLLRLDRAESVVLYVVRADGEVEVTGHRIADSGSGGQTPIDADARSRLVSTIGRGSSVHGAIWLTSSDENVFTAAHQDLVECVADQVSLALQHDMLRSTEILRRERLDTLDRLLHTMAEALDIRHIFTEVSDVVREGLPHDILVLTSWGEDSRSFRVYAMTGEQVDDPSFWTPTILSEDDRGLLHRDPYIVRDVEAEIPPGSIRGRLLRRFGVRSALRVPTSLGTGVFGSLFFLARETDRFNEADIDFARHVSDLLALALSHQRLSEAARRDAAARETAAQLEAQVATLTRELEARTGHRRVVGHSAQWRDVLAHAARVAHTETTVLLTGESGTGKEVVARFIHQGSRRKHGPFVAINCAALPDQLLESELFGHERGAFTGAVNAKPGRIEQATGGVLFFDEVGEMAPTVQAKVLRVLEEREFQRLGGTKAMRADIRVVAATNRDLHAAMRRGEFREDLYYRLGVFEIALPPLRHRPDDIMELANAFLEEIGATVGRPATGIDDDARAQLLAYGWPGNVRELRNAIERAVILADGGHIRSEHLPVAPRPFLGVAPTGDVPVASAPIPPGGVNLDAIERALVVKALEQARHNKTRAAKLLGLTRAQLYSRIEKYGLAETEMS